MESTHLKWDSARLANVRLLGEGSVPFTADDRRPERLERTAERWRLLDSFERRFADRASIGSRQFVYFDPHDPSRRVAPALFVHLGGPDELFEEWKTWERGVPELALEIVTSHLPPEVAADVLLERYLELGVRELAWFAPEKEAGRRLSIWDRTDGKLVERHADGDCSACAILGATWQVVEVPVMGPCLVLC